MSERIGFLFSKMVEAAAKAVPVPAGAQFAQGRGSFLISVAFHPSAPYYLATGRYDGTVKFNKLWLLNADCRKR
jgi:hypothetical protein